MIRVATRDLDEAVSAVSGVYCPHTLTLAPRARAVSARLRAETGASLGHVRLEYGAAVDVDAHSLQGITLVMHAVRGGASVLQPRGRTPWRAGQTVIVSGGQDTRYRFDAMFAQSTLRLQQAEIRRGCEAMLGVSLDEDVRFDPAPLPGPIESLWAQILAISSRRDALPASGLDYLNRLAIDLLLQRAPHSHSRRLGLPGPSARPEAGLAAHLAELVDAMPEYEVLTVSAVAASLGVSVRTLERAFRSERGQSPAEYLRGRRLDRVRAALEQPGEATLVIDVAAAHGFYHAGRLSGYYRERFGEYPSETLARSRRLRGLE